MTIPTAQELFQAVMELTEENDRLREENKKLRESRLPLYMGAADIAKELGVSKLTAYRLMAQPDFPSFKLNNSSKANKRVHRDDFLKWQESRKYKPA